MPARHLRVSVVDSSYALLTWRAPNITYGDERYTVVYGTSPSELNMRSAVLNQTQAMVTRLTPNTKYFFLIHTISLAGERNSYYIHFRTRTIKSEYSHTIYRYSICVVINILRCFYG